MEVQAKPGGIMEEEEDAYKEMVITDFKALTPVGAKIKYDLFFCMSQYFS
jgi:hypothetical protein